MSKTIDEKVVEMKFDNKHFETNVQTSLSTLDKLKAKLNLTGASKGLENISKAANNVNMNGLQSGLNTIHSKFSALETIGVGALLNIGNAAANAGKRLVASLSGMQAAMSGFNEYSMTMNTVQTLVNSTGKSVKQVEKQLKELDDYADKTVYSTADMFNNIYKFTNAGIDLKTAKTAMIGIANATAYAGQGAQQASIAYYNLAQSMSMGYLTTIDYKSLNLANIATKEFKQRMADAAVAAGTLKKTNDNLYSTGKKSYTLQALFTEGLKDQWATTNVMMDVFKQYGSQETEIGKKAWAAAQEVKTFGMMMESLQAQAGTSWKETWQILFGSLDDAKRMWTGLANFIGNIIDKVSTWRNTILDIAMNNPLKKLLDKINNNKVLKSFQEVSDKVKKTSKTLEEYQKMVSRIWRGDFKNQPYRKALVEQQGFNYEATQSLVNLTDKIAGYGKGWKAVSKITEKDVIEAEKKYGIQVKQTTESIKKEQQVAQELTDKQLKKAGLTKDEIYMYRQLEKGAKKYGLTIDELAKKMDKANGRDLLYGSKNGKIVGVFQNIGTALTNVFNAIKKGWTETFSGITGVDLYMLIERLNKFTESIRKVTENKEEMQKLTDTFKGLFSIIHIITSVIGGGFKIALQVVKGILGAFNIDLLDFTAMIGRAISGFDKWLTENNLLVEAVKTITQWIITAVIAVKDWVANNEKIMSVIEKIKNAFAGVKGSVDAWIKGLRETKNIPEYIFGGLINGIKEKGPKVWEAIKNIASGIVDAIKAVLRIQSPSKVMFAIGGFIIAGLIKGMADGSINLLDSAKDIAQNIINVFKGIDLGNVIAIGITGGLMFTVNKMIGLVHSLISPLEGLRNLFTGLGNMLSDFGEAAKSFGKAKKYNAIANLIKSISMSLLMLAGALFILAKLPADQLKQGSIALGAMTGVLFAFTTAIILMSKKLTKIDLPDVKTVLATILGLTVSMYVMASALKKLSKIEPDRMVSAICGLVACAFAMGVLLVVLGRISKDLKGTRNVEKLGKVYTKIAASMLLVAIALKIISGVDNDGIKKAGIVFAGLVALLWIIAKLNQWSPNSMIKSAETIKAVGTAMLLLVIATKLAGMLKPEEFVKAIGVIGLFSLLLLAIMGISKLFPKTEMVKVGASILFIVGAIGLLALCIKLLGNMKDEQFKKGLKCVGFLSAFVAGLILVSKKSASFHGLTLIGVAVAVVAMGLIAWLLGNVETEKLKKGITAVGFLSLFVSVLIKSAEKFAPGEKAVSTLITITVMLVLLVAAMVGLSFIEPQKLLSASTAMFEVIMSLAAVIYAVGKLKPNKGIGKTLLMLTGIMLLLAGVIAVLSFIPNIDNAIKGATGVAILAGTLSLMVFALSNIDGRKNVNKKFILALYSLVPLLIGIAVALMIVGNTQNAIKNAIALSILLGTMTVVLAAVSVIGKYLGGGLIAGVLGLLGITVALIGVAAILSKMDNLQNAVTNAKALALLLAAMSLSLLIVGAIGTNWIGVLAGVLGLLAIVGELFLVVEVLKKMEGLTNAIPNAIALSILLNAMSTALLKLGLVGPLALIADVALAGLLAVILAFGVVATAIGALMTKFPQLEQFLDKGLPILEKIAAGIGKVLGALVANFMGKIADELPHTGKKLSEFMINAMPFITIAQTVNDKVLNGVGILAKAILALTGANLVDAIANWISGGQSFDRLGKMLSDFAIKALPFITIMSMVKPEALKGAKNLAEAVLAFTASNFIESLSGKIFGESDYGSFGEKLGTLAKGLSSFVNNLKGFDKKNLDTIKVACEGIKNLTEASQNMPKEGGVWQKLVGSVDIKTFGEKLPKLAEGLVKFCKTLVDGGFKDIDQGLIKTATDMIKGFVDVANSIPAEGGVWQKLAGEKDLGNFASHFPQVGAGIAGFVNKLSENGGLTNDSVEQAKTAANIMWALTSLGNLDIGNVSDNLWKLGEKLTDFGSKIGEFVKSLKEVGKDDLTDSSEKMDLIANLASKLKSIDSKTTKSFKDFSNKLKDFGLNAIQEFINSLQNADMKTKAETAISTLLNALNTVLSGYEKPFNDEGVKLVGEAVKGLEDSGAAAKAKTAGENFGQGFINGINAKSGIANTTAWNLGHNASIALQKGTDEHSPSKITHRIGNFFGEGFIIGIKEYNNKVYSQSSELATKARDGLSKAISGVSNLIAGGIDDDITIRPILDLSNVQAGAASINGMFASPSIGVMSNLNAISSGMRSYRQNGGENVVDAIDRLGKNLGNTSGDTYHIDGITYDDGSNVASAVQTLIRAAKIERRK